MVTSVYDWMVAQRRVVPAAGTDIKPGDDDVLVRILKALDAEASRAPVPTT